MIGTICSEVYDLVRAIPALASSTGLVVGGKEPDPGMVKIPLPAAWILPFRGENRQDKNDPLPPSTAMVEHMVMVVLLVPYATQPELIASYYPLVDAVIAAVHGQQLAGGQRAFWRDYELKLVNPDRLGFHILFDVPALASIGVP